MESAYRLIILAALVSFLIAKGFVALSRRVRSSEHSARRRPNSSRRCAVQRADEYEPLATWTALDDLQLKQVAQRLGGLARPYLRRPGGAVAVDF